MGPIVLWPAGEAAQGLDGKEGLWNERSTSSSSITEICFVLYTEKQKQAPIFCSSSNFLFHCGKSYFFLVAEDGAYVRLRVIPTVISCRWKKRCRISRWANCQLTNSIHVLSELQYYKKNTKKGKEKKNERSRRNRLRFQINGKPQSQKGWANEYNWISRITRISLTMHVLHCHTDLQANRGLPLFSLPTHTYTFDSEDRRE